MSPVPVDKEELFEVEVVLGLLLTDLEGLEFLEKLLRLHHCLSLDNIVLQENVVQLPAGGIKNLLGYQPCRRKKCKNKTPIDYQNLRKSRPFKKMMNKSQTLKSLTKISEDVTRRKNNSTKRQKKLTRWDAIPARPIFLAGDTVADKVVAETFEKSGLLALVRIRESVGDVNFFAGSDVGRGRNDDAVLLKDEAGVGVAGVVDHGGLQVDGGANLLFSHLKIKQNFITYKLVE